MITDIITKIVVFALPQIFLYSFDIALKTKFLLTFPFESRRSNAIGVCYKNITLKIFRTYALPKLPN
jgi:hypothetical protein